jgi:hypothetical protein
VSHLFRGRALPAAVACLTIGALAGIASATAVSAIGQSPSGTNATVSCARLDTRHVRCMMTVKGGGLSGTVRMRITRGKLVVALGHGRVTRGEATLTMRVLHQMTPGQSTRWSSLSR